MTRNSKIKASKSGILASFAQWRLAPRSRSHNPAVPFFLEQLEDRLLMSRGPGGGSDLLVGAIFASDFSGSHRGDPVVVTRAATDLANDHSGGGPNSGGSGGSPVP